MTDGFGRMLPEPFAWFDPDVCSWRTSQGSLLSTEELDSIRFSVTWPKQGMTRGGLAYELRTLALPTGEIDSSLLLRTPNAAVTEPKSTVTKLHGRTPADPQVGLADQIKAIVATPIRNQDPSSFRQLLPTPNAERVSWRTDTQLSGDGRTTPNKLGWAVSLLPTPRATRGGSGSETMLALGAERTDESRPQGELLLPTPTVQDSKNVAGAFQDERHSDSLNVVARKLSGVHTGQRLTVGSTPWDGQLHLPLTTEDS